MPAAQPAQAPAKSAQHSARQPAMVRREGRVLGREEQLRGTLYFVGPKDNDIAIRQPNGAAYSFHATRNTRVLVNGKRVNIPSYQVRPGDVVEVAEKAKAQLRVKAAAEAAESRGVPDWMEVDAKALKGTFKALPTRPELPSSINESLVIELYSK